VGVRGLRGGVGPAEGMGGQKAIAAAIRAGEADYVLTVKDNQPALRRAIHEAFLAHAEDDYSDPTVRRPRTGDEGHGRKETRGYVVAAAPGGVSRGGEGGGVGGVGGGGGARAGGVGG